MNRATIARLFLLGFLGALLLSLVSLFSLNRIMDYGASNHRRYMILSIANSIEDRPLDKSILPPMPQGFGGPGGPPPPGFGGPNGPPPPGGFGFFPPPPRGGPGGGPPPFMPRMSMWVISESGEVIASSDDKPLPEDWKKIPRSSVVHEITSNESLFTVSATTYITKLGTKTPAYLVFTEGRRPFFSGPIFATQALLTFAAVSIAIFFSLFMTFLYLRKKSQDAKEVLYRLEKGDLKARFEIKRVDEFGVLMLDFNRMADEIERLVLRIHETEKSRKNLLQELGHDLRTPLTGLTTAYETLKYHFAKISESERDELFNIIGGEVTYLRDLLEKLLTIATIDEPHYKKTTEVIDLEDLVSQEIKSRKAASNTESVQWHFESKVSGKNPESLLGDPHLITRLVRNGLDNAAKYARRTIKVSVLESDRHFEVLIDDDGPGISVAAQESFGKRKDYRARAVSGLHYSIGLGSVIMKTIAELHGGSVDIQNKLNAHGDTEGALLKISLPKVL